MKYFKSFSSIALVYIIISALYKYIYFRAFGINIFHYVSIGETFALFDTFFILILLAIFLTSLVPFILDRKVKDLNDSPSVDNDLDSKCKEFIPYLNKEGFLERIIVHIKENLIALLLGLSFYIISLFNNHLTNDKKDLLNIFVYFFIIFILLNYFKLELIDRISRLNKIDLKKFESIFSISTLFLTFYIIYCVYSIKQVYWKSDKMITLYLKKEVKIQSNDTLKYLGKTEKLFFFKDVKNNSTYIFKDENVEKIKIKY